MKLICGLGNPGKEYARHRHNVGFGVVELLLSEAGSPRLQRKFDGLAAQGQLAGQAVLFLLPQTFMNVSGKSLAGAASFYKVSPEDILVVHDELDLPFGRLQLKRGGGAGGHNGLRSIIEWLGTGDFARLRFGIGKPQVPGDKERVVGHVLSGFSSEELETLPSLLTVSGDAARCWATDGLDVAMNRFNRR
jgi:PTH1 family peptidyl-tRNA hydrolase